MKVRRLHDSIYEADIALLVSPIRELRPWLTRQGFPADDETATWAQGKTMEYTPTQDGTCWFLWLPLEATHSTVAHECVHLAAQVLRDRDVRLTRASEEAYAYYVSAMFDQIVRALAMFRARSMTTTKTKKRRRA